MTYTCIYTGAVLAEIIQRSALTGIFCISPLIAMPLPVTQTPGGPPGDYPPPGGSTTTVTIINVPVPDIIDSLKDTCLNKTLHKILLTQNINNTIGNLLNKVFNSNSKVNITYAEDNNLTYPRLANTPAPGSWTLNAAGDTVFNITVYLIRMLFQVPLKN